MRDSAGEASRLTTKSVINDTETMTGAMTGVANDGDES